MILIVFLRRKVKNPLNSLIQKIRLTDPQKPKVIELDKADTETEEIFLILTSFNSMIKELAKFKDVLEAIVENKTERLKERNIEVRNLVSMLENAQDQIIKQEKINGLSLVAAGIAHDLREPLNLSNQTTASLSKLILNKEHTEINKADFKAIRTGIDLLTETNIRFESILKSMVLQTNPVYSQPGHVNLRNVTETNYTSAIGLKELSFKSTIVHKIDINSDLTIEVFPSEFNKLLFNLYENSFSALEQKYKNNFETEKIYIPEICTSAKKYGKDKILFTIHDNGAGISDDIKSKIFDPFFSNKSDRMTTGLGLYMVSEIVQKHKGELSVNSEENIYTEFRIILPIKLI
jgi:signal transduction histidine kinase